MNEQKPINAEEKPIKPDDLTKTKKPGDVKLTEEELSKASGGYSKIKISYNLEEE